MISSQFFPKTDRDALIVLNAVSGLGNRRALELVQHCGSPRQVFEAAHRGALREAGLIPQVLLNLQTFDGEAFVLRETERAAKESCRIVTILDEEYPARLKEIADAPIVLYVKGRVPQALDCSVAIVGARHPTIYGLQMAERFARELGDLGVAVVSGLARGIDAAAHRGCLRAGGQTVGVLGCGLDIVYPRDNRDLFVEMERAGSVISEFPFGTPPLPYHFPRRNRIVSALSYAVLVVEANLKSGALITAEFALDQGRDVFALPGRVDSPLSHGPHQLIRQGAKLVENVQDILGELPLAARGSSEEGALGFDPSGLDPHEKIVCDIIKEGPVSLEEIQHQTGAASSGLMAPLLSLQLKKVIRELPGKLYELVRGR